MVEITIAIHSQDGISFVSEYRKPSTVTAISIGSTMTSRESQEVRHIIAARQARSGLPRWKNEAMSPSPSNTSAAGNAKVDKKDCVKICTGISRIAKENSKPCAMPANVVKKMIENCGRINCLSLRLQWFP